MDNEAIRQLLEAAQTIAVVGASPKSDRPSHAISKILIEAGYTVIPVHPTADEILAQQAYPSLHAIPVHVDIVDVFMRADRCGEVAREAVAVGAGALWLQTGIVSDEARLVAAESGLSYVEDRCTGATVRLMQIRK